MKACLLKINDRYLYTGGAVNTEIKYIGFGKKGHVFQYVNKIGFISLSAYEVKAFIEEDN